MRIWGKMWEGEGRCGRVRKMWEGEEDVRNWGKMWEGEGRCEEVGKDVGG